MKSFDSNNKFKLCTSQSFLHSFYQILTAYHMAGNVLSAGDLAINKKDKSSCPTEAFILMERDT